MIFDFFRVTILNFQIYLVYRRGFQRKRILKRNLKRSADSTYKPVAKLYTRGGGGKISFQYAFPLKTTIIYLKIQNGNPEKIKYHNFFLIW
jgi:hypothetical protein